MSRVINLANRFVGPSVEWSMIKSKGGSENVKSKPTKVIQPIFAYDTHK